MFPYYEEKGFTWTHPCASPETIPHIDLYLSGTSGPKGMNCSQMTEKQAEDR